MTWFRHMRSLVCLTLLTMGRQEGGAVPIIAYTGWRCLKGVPLSGFGYIGITLVEVSSSETQGQSVGSGEKARRKVLSTGGFFHPGLEKNEWNECRYSSANYALRDQVAKKKYQPLSQQWSLLHVAVLSQYWSLCKPTKINVSSCVISGNLTAHLSSLIHPDRKVFAFGVPQESHEMIEDKLERMAARSILFIEHVLKLFS